LPSSACRVAGANFDFLAAAEQISPDVAGDFELYGVPAP
jgi:hypothetical protein